MTRSLLLGTFLSIVSLLSFAQSVPFPPTPDPTVLAPWGYQQVGTNWDTSPYLPFRYNNNAARLMPPNGVTYNRTTNSWTFSEPGKKYPLILFFHGAGENGGDNNNQLRHGGRQHRDAVLSGQFPGFLFYPQQVTQHQAKVFLDKLIETLPIDINRIYVHGLSAGGQWTYQFAISYPTMVAAMAPMSAVVDGIRTETQMYTPIRLAQGGRDTNPPPWWSQRLKDWFDEDGGHLEYFYFPDLGHGTWNSMYALPDFFTWFLKYSKNTIMVRYDKNELCPEDPISVVMGFTPGFEAYEWRKDGVLMPGQTQYRITATEFGVYTGRIRNRGEWSEWSAPVEVKIKAVTNTPPIQLSGLQSNVLPAPDGKTAATLELPTGYEEYTWRNATTNAIVSTDRVFTAATPGSYKAVVKEVNGCSSNESPIYTVASANGPNKPDPVSGFLGYATSQTEITLTWNDNPAPAFNETGFEIYRGSSPSGPFQLIAINAPDEKEFNDSNLTPNTQYYYIVRPVTATGAATATAPLAVPTQVDAELPTTPANLRVVSRTPSSVTLQWDASTDNVGVFRYDVYKDGVKSLAVSGTTATLYNLQDEQLYNFTVQARDYTGNLSPESNQVTHNTSFDGLYFKRYTLSPAPQVLPNFNTLTPVATGFASNISLSGASGSYGIYWEGYINIPVAGNYTFETYSDDGSKVYIGGYDESLLVVNNDGRHGEQYREGTKNFASPGRYKIVVTFFYINSGGATMQLFWKNTAHGVVNRQQIPNSAFESNFVPGGIAPVAPTQLNATAVSYDQINLAWTDNSNNETAFKIYRSTNNAGPFVAIGTSATASYIDKAVQPATTYYYRVEAINSYGESGFSNEVARGLNYSYYQQTSFSNYNLTNLTSLTPIKTGVSATFDLSPQERSTQFAFRWVGKINIPTSGQYTFFTTSDDGSRLYIDNNLVVNNDFNQGMIERSGNVNLTAGQHDIDVRYRQVTGGMGLEVRYQGPDLTKQLIPASAHNGTETNATTLPLPPAPNAPTNCAAVATSTTAIQLTWTDASSDESSFVLYRSVGGTSNFLQYKTLPANTTSYNDVGLFGNSAYHYKVAAVNVGGSSESQIASANTLNNIPVLSQMSDVAVRFGTPVSIGVVAEDLDNGQLTLSSVLTLPSFLTFTDYGDGTGLLEGTPLEDDIGVYVIMVKVTDPNGGMAIKSFMLMVSDLDPPALVPISDLSIAEGSTGTVLTSATAGWGVENLTWTVEGLPAFAQFNVDQELGEASIVFNPGFIDAGYYPIKVQVRDLYGIKAIQSFILSVTDVDPNTKFHMNIVHTTSATAPWNNITGRTTSGLRNAKGEVTSVGLNFVTNAWNTWYDGHVTGNNSGVVPDNVINDYYFFGIYGAPNTVTVDVTGLDPAMIYSFKFFGSSDWPLQADNGTTIYTINGVSASLHVQNNTQNFAVINNVVPAANGTVTFTMQKATGTPVGYLNAFIVESTYQYGTTPAPPKDLSAVFVNDESILLSWFDVPFNEDGFDVYRSLSESGPFTKINGSPLPANTTQYSDTNVAGGVTYYYKLKSFNQFGESAFSETEQITTNNIAPVIQITGNTNAVIGTTTQIGVSATDLPDNNLVLSVTGLPAFANYQATNAISGNVVLNPTASDLGTYSFTVRAADAQGAETVREVNFTVGEAILYRYMVNFTGQSGLPAVPWNNTSKAPQLNDVFNLRDDAGVNRGVQLTLLSQFGGAYNQAPQTGDNSGMVPDFVLSQYYWFGIYGAPEQVNIRLSGLSTLNKYNFKFVAASLFTGGGTVNNGNTVFTIGSKSASVNVQNNTTTFAEVKDVVTNASGQINITISKGLGAVAGFVNGFIVEVIPLDPATFAPSDLSASGYSTSEIQLKWTDNSPTETGFEVYRSTDKEGTYTLIATLPADQLSYVDSNITTDDIFYYKIRAIAPGGPTEYSNVAASGTIKFKVYVNINSSATYDAPIPWNNLSRVAEAGDVFYGFRDGLGEQTGMLLRVKTPFVNFNDFGVNTGNNSGVFPDNVLRSFYYNDPSDPIAEFVVENLDQTFNYNFGFLGSFAVGTGAWTKFTIGSQAVINEVANNSTRVSYINNVIPNENSEVLIEIDEGQTSQWGIWNAMVIEAYPTDRKANASARSASKLGNHEVRYGEGDPRITLHPNPVTGNRLNVRISNASIGEVQYTIFDVMGKVLSSGVVNNDLIDAEFDVNLDSYQSAVYFIKIVHPSGRQVTEKFIKR